MKRDHLQELLWYQTPAECWIEALPVGNGRLGAMVYGGVNRDRLALNEETLWDGKPTDKHNPAALEALPEVRRLLFAGENEKASELAERTMVSMPNEPFPYLPLCDLLVECKVSRSYRDYRRELDLQTAEATVSCTRDGAGWHKSCFVSAPDQVLIYRIESGHRDGIQAKLGLERETGMAVEWLGDDTLLATGGGADGGLRYTVLLRAVAEPGTVAREAHGRGAPRLDVEGARTLTLYLTACTDYRGRDPEAVCRRTMEAALAKGYEAIRADHRREYGGLYNRFSLELSPSATEPEQLETPDTATRLERLREGGVDPAFYTLLLNYNRYLLISASRPGCRPSTLQGIWNDQMDPPWQSDYHTNVNFQINYWTAEAFGLPECHEPVFDWLEDTAVLTGAETARRQYGAGGWVLHHATDLWGVSSPIFSLLGIWPVGGTWLCRHLFEHYAYHPDRAFLRERAFPLVEGAARFLLDFLVEAPARSACPGKLVTCPSHSPENRFRAPDGSDSWFTYACTMDNQIVADLFRIALEMIDLLAEETPGFRSGLREELAAALARLPETVVSPRTGCIQEWIEDYEEFEPGHRHVSHLYALYPGTAISPEKTPGLAAAAEKTLARRLSCDYDGQGWSLGWIANIYARMGRGDRVQEIIEEIARRHILQNLMVNAHGNPQVGDAQALPAAMLEGLAQSHGDEIVLLPALPPGWSGGSVTGMRLRGGCALDMVWSGGRVERARIYSLYGGELPPVRTPVEAADYRISRSRAEVVFARKGRDAGE